MTKSKKHSKKDVENLKNKQEKHLLNIKKAINSI